MQLLLLYAGLGLNMPFLVRYSCLIRVHWLPAYALSLFATQLMQAQQDPQRPALPAYLSPPPYLSPPGIAAYGINGGTGSTGSFTQPGSAHSTPQYTTLLPSSPYQYPYPYQHYETAVGAVHQGAGAAHHGLSVAAAQYGSAVGRTAELYGERSDGACSVSSSRPMSAISIGSAMADGLHSYGGHPALRLYSAGRTAVVRSASPAAAAAASGRNSPMPPAAAHGAASGSSAAQQQHPSNASTTQQQQGALPPNPFLGSALRRPASATSRAGGAGGGGGGGAGHEGPPEWGPHQQQGAAAVAAGGAPGLARSGSTVGGGSGSSSAYPHGGYPGGSAALQQLQQLQAAAAALAAAQAVGPAPGAGGGFLQFGVSAGSAHNHVRAAHSSALEAPGTAGAWCGVWVVPALVPLLLQSAAKKGEGAHAVRVLCWALCTPSMLTCLRHMMTYLLTG